MLYVSFLSYRVQTHMYVLHVGFCSNTPVLCVAGYRAGYSEESSRATQSSADVAERRRCHDNGLRDVSQPVTVPQNHRWGVKERDEERAGGSRYTNFIMGWRSYSVWSSLDL